MVFVAMPFDDPRSEELWETVDFVCRHVGLRAVRADRFRRTGSIMRDVREGIHRAGIVVADLTGLNANVLYEVGLAHAESENVVLLCERPPALPFNFADQRTVFYSWKTADDRKRLTDDLWDLLQRLRPPIVPSVIEGKVPRSQSTIRDLRALLDLSPKRLAGECVWFSGFLSTLAIDESETFAPEEDEYREALLEDKRLLIELARKGCPVRLIISPPHPGRVDDIWAEGRETTILRLMTLRAFLTNENEPALERMEFVVSPFRQKHLYIIGQISVSEGFKIKLERGYQLTLRQDNPDAVSVSIAAQEILFNHLKKYTYDTYASQDLRQSSRTLRDCAIEALTVGFNTANTVTR